MRGPGRRLRAGLRRHGVLPRPRELRRMLRASDVRFTTGNAIELYEEGGRGLLAEGVGEEHVRRDDWKLIEFFDTDTVELYHLAEDPGERHNLADKHPDKTAELRKQLADWRRGTVHQ